MKEKTSSADILPHRGSKVFSVRKPFDLLKDIKIRIALLHPNNKYSGPGFHLLREGGGSTK